MQLLLTPSALVETAYAAVLIRCPNCHCTVLDEEGFLVRLYIFYATAAIKDDKQRLQSDQNARCRTCGESVRVDRVFSREAEAQQVADRIRVSLMMEEDAPEGFQFIRR